MPILTAADLARHLAGHAEAVCRHYLSNGRREGRYWRVGDVRNTPGRSMFVRLVGQASGKGAAGKWTDAATGEHGDLIDVIRATCWLETFAQVAAEARRFLALPDREHHQLEKSSAGRSRSHSQAAARRLYSASNPVQNTLAETYLASRGITSPCMQPVLRFHPRCYYWPDDAVARMAWPAMIAAVTDHEGQITGVQRTWLDHSGRGKAPIDNPRRSIGDLLGHGVRFGQTSEIMAAGEGIETVLSLRMALPTMPMVAALSASHLAALALGWELRRLYIALDRDSAGDRASAILALRAKMEGTEAIVLSPMLGDFNEDLRLFGINALRAALRCQLAPEDAHRFLPPCP